MDRTSLSPALSLNQLSLTGDEAEKVLAFFSDMAKDETALSDSALDGLSPMVHVVSLTNVLREDTASQPFSRDDLQRDAPEASDGCWQVPRLLE